ncbi:MAG: hypothetical protein O7F76_08910 [Planctomycetota bacterium]|nr:hypothetical protein [Planctomycetota bacterium]
MTTLIGIGKSDHLRNEPTTGPASMFAMYGKYGMPVVGVAGCSVASFVEIVPDESPTAVVTTQQIQMQVTSPTAPLETILLIGLLLP